MILLDISQRVLRASIEYHLQILDEKNALFRALPELTLPPIRAPSTTFFRARNSRFESV